MSEIDQNRFIIAMVFLAIVFCIFIPAIVPAIGRLRHWVAHRPVPGHYPIFIFGLFIVIYSGKWADIRLPGGWLVVCWRKKRRYIYFSPDGTPNRAKWGFGKYNY